MRSLPAGSAFNVRAKSLRLGDFSAQDIESLLAQHTQETDQAFTSEARAVIRELTRGQPWLVNALAYEACFDNRAGRDRSRAITGDAIQDAREELILRRETPLDQLADKLREERVRRVVEPLLSRCRGRRRDCPRRPGVRARPWAHYPKRPRCHRKSHLFAR